MPIVRFLPSNTTVEVPAGSLIHEAAIKAGLEELHLPCGGKGTCGRCLIEIVEGTTEGLGHSHLADALAGGRLVMACQTKVRDDLVVSIRPKQDDTMRVVGDSHVLISEDLLPDLAHLSPLSRVVQLSVPTATIEEHYSDWQRLVRELAPAAHVAVTTDVTVLRQLAEVLRAQDGRVTVTVREEDTGLHVLAVEAGHVPHSAYGLAIDIGTTTCAVQLVDLLDGRVRASRTSYNAQIRRGADIISRIDYARTPERQADLRELVLETLNELTEGVLGDAGIDAQTVHAAFIAGNTTMIHLLLALPPRYIRESPYVPTVNTVPTLTAAEVGLPINPLAVVACAPGVGSYVGGDITAGLLCTELTTNHDEVFLFLDIGTNGEIVLGNADWLVTCACSAGPAFEGSGIKCGMRATDGAIEYFAITPRMTEISYDVIGQGKPAGICGSGLISLLGELLLCGVVDQMGRFNMELPTDRLIQTPNGRAFVLEWGANTRDGQDLFITEADIENLMRTKAAIYAACALILDNVGLEWNCIARVYIAGGFGRYIQIDDAVMIGLLPDLEAARFHYIGNSALTGAYIALLTQKGRQQLTTLAGRMTYIDLSSDPRYMDSYLGAMFLPHTNMSLFPTVAEKMAAARNNTAVSTDNLS
ncbi:MAG TPA: ASKHA domain-containing protein [Armatimonadota bacterium]|jgi:uncharacterized 2Fe-2S/4Fe-4S cluster protein (DUF4445 family)